AMQVPLADMASATHIRERVPLRRRSMGPAWTNAIAWKDFYFVGGGTHEIIGKFLLYGALILLPSLISPETRAPESWISWALAIMLALVAIDGIRLAGQLFKVEVTENTLGGLLVLPFSAGEIASSKVKGIGLALAPALFYLIAIG